MKCSSKTSHEVPAVTCGTCVAIAIVKQHRKCLCSLLQRGHLRSDLFWLRALHLIKNDVEWGPPMSPSWKLHPFLENCSCIFEMQSSEVAAFSNLKDSTMKNAVSFSSCDHLVVSEPEDEIIFDENALQTVFLSCSLTR